MLRRVQGIAACTLIVITCAAAAEETSGLGTRTLFEAQHTGSDEWETADDLTCRGSDDGLVLELRGAESGWAAPRERVDSAPGAMLRVQPTAIEGGTLVLQIEWFDATGRFLQAVEALTMSEPSAKPVERKLAEFWPRVSGEQEQEQGPTRFRVKLWLSGDECKAVLRTLVITAPRRWSEESVRLVRAYGPRSRWKPDPGMKADAAGDSLILRLEPGRPKGFAGLVLTERVDFTPRGVIMLDLPAVRRGSVSLQAVCFDDTGAYIESVDLLKDITTAGLTEIPMRLYASLIPKGTATLEFKLWLAGNDPEAHVAGLFYGVRAP